MKKRLKDPQFPKRVLLSQEPSGKFLKYKVIYPGTNEHQRTVYVHPNLIENYYR